MARKTTNIKIIDGGLEHKIVIRQMPAMQLHDFTLKVGMLLLETEVAASMTNMEIVGQIGEKFAKNGLGALRGLSFEKLKPLTNELLACCERVTDSGAIQQLTPDVIDGIFDDVASIFKLELEAVRLNFSFFLQALVSPENSPEIASGVEQQTSKA